MDLTPIESVVPQQVSDDDELIATWVRSFRSVNTRAAYASDVAVFRSTCPKPLREITVRDLQAFAEEIEDLAPATQSRRLSSVKSLITFGHRLGWLPFDPGARIRLPAIKDTLSERILSEEQVIGLLSKVRQPRNAALLRLVYHAGLRISEVCGLRWRDLSERGNEGQITVFGKGGKTRHIPLPLSTWSRLIALRSLRAGPDDPVFYSREGGPLKRSRVHEIFKAAAYRAGLPAAVSIHWLRHAHASHALDRNAPVHVVQHTLGHASLSTTTRYTHARPGDSSARYLAI